MAAKIRPFRVFSADAVLLFASQQALGRWLSKHGVVPGTGDSGFGITESIRVEFPGGASAPDAFLDECVRAYRNRRMEEVLASLGFFSPRRFSAARRRKTRYRMRRMRTTQERRLHCVIEDWEPPVRAARRPGSLPHSWDDYWRQSTRSWKKHRRRQWREAA